MATKQQYVYKLVVQYINVNVYKKKPKKKVALMFVVFVDKQTGSININ